jgi:hypothetical protein
MAKVGKLAGLAALGALAYMNRDKLGMGKETEGPAATAAEKEASDARAKAQKNAISGNNLASSMSDEAKAEMKRETQRGSIGSIPSKPKSTSLAKPPVGSDKASLRDAEAGKSRGSRPSTNTSSSSEDGMRNYSTRSGSLAGAGRGSVNPSMVTPSSPRDSETSMSRGTRAASTKDGMKNYKPRYTPPMLAPKTTQGDGRKPYMPEDVDMSIGQKRGGMVKKMASGGMTASRRADGIATKGKTRGRMC